MINAKQTNFVNLPLVLTHTFKQNKKMATQHLTFVRKFEKVAIVVAVVDVSELENIPDESFVVSTMSKSIYTNMLPSIQLSNQVIESPSETKGNSIDGILLSPNWFIRKVKTLFEDLLTPTE